MTLARSRKILLKLREYYGKPSAALRYRGIYQLAVSVVLSAQTTDSQVNAVTPGLFAAYPDFASLARASRAGVEKIIRSTGFYHHKAKNIIALAGTVMRKHEGEVPRTREELMELPGIGRKSANVILAMGFGVPAFAVDTHVYRVARRIGYTGSSRLLDVEEGLMRFIPDKDWIEGHLLFILHGRKVCRARNPLCPECPVNSLCDFAGNNP
jgi:endonuclease-3